MLICHLVSYLNANSYYAAYVYNLFQAFGVAQFIMPTLFNNCLFICVGILLCFQAWRPRLIRLVFQNCISCMKNAVTAWPYCCKSVAHAFLDVVLI